MSINKKAILFALYFLTHAALASVPHFFVQMENRSDKQAAISFQKGVGNVWLEPNLADKTPLPSHQKSMKYQVNIEPLDPKATFNIIFTGKQNCNFNIAYYAPANPKVTVSGFGCHGGGYEITGNQYTLLLYISDINLKHS